MAKYYVESGAVRMVVQANDERSAALWAVHRALEEVLPIYDDPAVTSDEKAERALAVGLRVLSDTARVHDTLDGPSQTKRFETSDLVAEWSQLMVALTRLESAFLAAA